MKRPPAILGSIARLPRRLHWLAAALALVFGLGMLLLTPPLQCMDEENHFARAYQIGMGHVFPDVQDGTLGLIVPRSVVDLVTASRRITFKPGEKYRPEDRQRDLHRQLEPDDLAFLPVINTSLYSPLVYLPHLPGILLGRLLGLPPVLILYLARLTGLIYYLVMVWLVIRLAPFGKWLFALLMLMPVPLFTGSCLSADATVLPLCYLFIVLVLAAAMKPPEVPVTRREWLPIAGLMVALSQCKSVFVLLALLVLLIPWRRFGDRRRWLLTIGGSFAVMGVAFVLWAAAIGHYYQPKQPGFSMSGQLAWVARHPIAYGGVIWQMLTARQIFMLVTTVGALGWQDAMIPQLAIMLYVPALLFAGLVVERPAAGLTPRLRLWLFASYLVFALAVCTAIYGFDEAVGNPVNRSITGRHLIPLLPLALLPLVNGNYRWRRGIWHNLGLVCFVAAVLGCACRALYLRYYVG